MSGVEVLKRLGLDLAPSGKAALLKRGCDDKPGVSHLPEISELLWVGNERAAACGSYDVVVSTIVPRDSDGEKAPKLTTHAVLFEDKQGKEEKDEVEVAREAILKGAEIVASAIADGKRTLVHCSWGQNRSCAICCAYAILYRRMSAADAIRYVQERNLADRRYYGQQPPGGAMHNRVFCELLGSLEEKRSGEEKRRRLAL
eukprot:TRINITY_DN57396_c0_g1_i1.p1 TRINITY_DN57396_c0_g1~~TRINITY_DN57396_c0_g1_i1.p1  ORF type:complete len:222 (+),score=49.18 TRINITY_DN57396_c0_g1_i1:65-667(+)